MSNDSLTYAAVPQACTLPTADQPMRLSEIGDLLDTDVRSVDRLDRSRLRLGLTPDPAVAARAADLAMRETGCCSFFTFTLTVAGGSLTLDITVPSEHVAVLDAVADRASGSTIR